MDHRARSPKGCRAFSLQSLRRTKPMTLEQITHDLASIDRVVYRTDLRRHGLHAWMLGRSSKAGEALLISFKVNEPFPTDEEWAARLADIKAKHAPSIVMAGAA